MPLPITATLALLLVILPARADPAAWRIEWPETDFSRHSVPFEEIISGGPPKDGIPSIDAPRFVPVEEAELAPREPVIGLTREGEASPRARRSATSSFSARRRTVGRTPSTRSTSPSPFTPSSRTARSTPPGRQIDVYVALFRDRLSFTLALGLGLVLWVLVLAVFFPVVGWGLFGLAVGPQLIVASLVPHILFAVFLWLLSRFAFGR